MSLFSRSTSSIRLAEAADMEMMTTIMLSIISEDRIFMP